MATPEQEKEKPQKRKKNPPNDILEMLWAAKFMPII